MFTLTFSTIGLNHDKKMLNQQNHETSIEFNHIAIRQSKVIGQTNYYYFFVAHTLALDFVLDMYTFVNLRLTHRGLVK